MDVVSAPLPDSALVTVAAGDTTLVEGVLALGGFITVTNGGNCLTGVGLSAFITDAESGELLQTATVAPNCQGGPLLEAFGGLQFAGYTCLSGETRSCFTDLFWNFSAVSRGIVPSQITQFDLEINGDVIDLNAGIDAAELALIPGEIVVRSRDVVTTLPVCGSQSVETTLTVTSDDGSAEGCSDSDSLDFAFEGATLPPGTLAPTPAPEPCILESSLACRTPDGLDCGDVVPPVSLTCARGDPIGSLTFSYQNCRCDEEFNNQGSRICFDTADIPEGEVNIQCFTTLGESLTVEPPIVEPLAAFTVTSPSSPFLPAEIGCNIFDMNGVGVQTVVINTSGQVELNLQDKFGAFRVEACDDSTCLATFLYDVELSNIGGEFADISSLIFTLNDAAADVQDLLPIDLIAPGVTTRIEGIEINDISICDGTNYCASIDAEANIDGQSCATTSEFKVLFTPEETGAPSVTPVTGAPVQPPTFPTGPTPTLAPIDPPMPEDCILIIDTSCVIGGHTSATGLSCDSPLVGVEPCLSSPTSAKMMFNGGNCDQADVEEWIKCQDFNFGPPTNAGEVVHITVTSVNDDNVIYFEGLVRVGEAYVLDDNMERFQPEQRIVVRTPDQGTVLQEVIYESACQNDLLLKVRLGASQLIEFTNEVQGTVSCFNEFDFSLQIQASVMPEDFSVTLSTVSAVTNFAGTQDLTPQVNGLTIGPDGTAVVTLSQTTDTSTPQRYMVMFFVEGLRNPDRATCIGTAEFDFMAGNSVGPVQ